MPQRKLKRKRKAPLKATKIFKNQRIFEKSLYMAQQALFL